MSDERLTIDDNLSIAYDEIDLSAIRAQGAGGQNVNKVASALHLRFDIEASSLPADVKRRLRARRDKRVTADGVLVIKAQQYRRQQQNRDDALERLAEFIRRDATAPARRRATRPTRASIRRRLDDKRHRSRLKADRGRQRDD